MPDYNFAPSAVGAYIDQIPKHILADLRQRGHSDEAIERMSPREVFQEYCEWNGLIRWGDPLWEAVSALKAIQDQIMPEGADPAPPKRSPGMSGF